MKADIKKKWLKALRSGKYKKGIGELVVAQWKGDEKRWAGLKSTNPAVAITKSTMEQTQRERVLRKLLDEGEVDNFWAFHNYILRLGAIIHRLRESGYEIDGMYGKDRGFERKLHKNYYYILKNRPKVDVF